MRINIKLKNFRLDLKFVNHPLNQIKYVKLMQIFSLFAFLSSVVQAYLIIFNIFIASDVFLSNGIVVKINSPM